MTGMLGGLCILVQNLKLCVLISYEGGSLLRSKKKVLSVFSTSTSSDIISSFLSKVIFPFELFFSERNGFTVYQSFLLSVIVFSFNFAKYCFFSFLRRDMQKFLLKQKQSFCENQIILFLKHICYENVEVYLLRSSQSCSAFQDF